MRHHFSEKCPEGLVVMADALRSGAVEKHPPVWLRLPSLIDVEVRSTFHPRAPDVVQPYVAEI
eukprot:5598507-Prymnesium_polylepis.1